MSSEAACPLCAHGSPRAFLHRTGVAVHQNLVCADEQAARDVPRGTLDLRCCARCGFVWNAAFEASLLSYGSAYDNTQTCSPAFSAHVDGLLRRIAEAVDLSTARVVEVGCGKGGFLRALLDVAGEAAHGHGFDPSFEGAEAERRGRLRFHRRFYDASCAEFEADVVVCRHVIEHVADPLALLRQVRAALRPGARVFFETPCVRWILREQAVWDFFYEHCALFAPSSLAAAFRAAGFVVDHIGHVFDGQYLWIEARAAERAEAPAWAAGDLPQRAAAWGPAEARWLAHWRRRLEMAGADGGACLWGAGAKGVTFAALVDPTRRLLEGLVDINPNKAGRFTPGSAHAILAPEALAGRGIGTTFVMNPNYRGEIRAMLDALGLDVALVDVTHPGADTP